jgi:hypothetical protein
MGFHRVRWPTDRDVWINYGQAHGSYWLFRTKWKWLMRRAGFGTNGDLPRYVEAVPSMWMRWFRG